MTEPRAVELDLEREADAFITVRLRDIRNYDRERLFVLMKEAAAEIQSLRAALAVKATPSICPICLGSGIREAKGPENAPLPVSTTASTVCHGCGGRGWV